MNNTTKILIVSIACWFISTSLSANIWAEPDTLPRRVIGMPDTLSPIEISPVVEKSTLNFKGLALKTKDFFNDETPKPQKALLFSLVLPGLGQAYNGKHWKIPIVYAGIGGLGFAVSWNRSWYKRFETAYIYRLDEDENTVDEFESTITTDSALKTNRDAFRKDLERAWLGLIAVYLLNGVDAYVDAHLTNFDVSEDLSIRIQPALTPTLGNETALGLSIIFQGRSPEKPTFTPFQVLGNDRPDETIYTP